MYGDFHLHAVYLKQDFTEYFSGFQIRMAVSSFLFLCATETTKQLRQMQYLQIHIDRQTETTRLFLYLYIYTQTNWDIKIIYLFIYAMDTSFLLVSMSVRLNILICHLRHEFDLWLGYVDHIFILLFIYLSIYLFI